MNKDQQNYVPFHTQFNRFNTPMYDIKTAGIYVKGKGILPSPAFRPNEVFKRSEKYPGYLIGNYGTVYREDMNCRMRAISTGRYFNVSVRNELGETISEFLHRLIMMAHCPIPNADRMTVNHRNKERFTNYYNPDDPNNNLEWRTITGNIHDSIDYDREHGGTFADYNIYTDDDIRTICRMVLELKNDIEIAKVLGVDNPKKIRDIVSKMRAGKYRTDIVSEFPPLPHRCNQITEEAIRRLCELISSGLKLADIKNTLYEEGYDISEPSIIKIRNKDIRYKKWWDIIDEYDFSNKYKPAVDRFTEEQLITICKMASTYPTADIMKAIGGDDTRAIQNVIHKLRSGKYRPDLTAKYPISYRSAPMTEELMREICEYISKGMTYGAVKKILDSKGMYVSKTTYYQVLSKSKAVAKWMPVIDQYDFSNYQKKGEYNYNDTDVDTACRLLSQGYSYLDTYNYMNMQKYNISIHAFKRFCLNLKRNAYSKYRHISSKYFN